MRVKLGLVLAAVAVAAAVVVGNVYHDLHSQASGVTPTVYHDL